MKRNFAFGIFLLMGWALFAQPWEGEGEISLFAGVHSGDRFVTASYGYDFLSQDIEDDTIYGFRASYFFTRFASMELTLARVETTTTYGDPFDITYYAGNFVFQWGRRALQPFVTIGLGASTLEFPSFVGVPFIYERQSETRIHVNYGVGFKLYFSHQVGIRSDIRIWQTNTDFNDYCYDYCYYTYDNDLTTVELSLGLLLKF